MTWLQALGLFGGALFAWAAVPQAIRTIKARKHLGTPFSIIAAIFFGTIVMYSYLHATRGFDWVLAVNYSIEALSWGVLLGFYIREAGGEWFYLRKQWRTEYDDFFLPWFRIFRRLCGAGRPRPTQKQAEVMHVIRVAFRGKEIKPDAYRWAVCASQFTDKTVEWQAEWACDWIRIYGHLTPPRWLRMLS